MNWILLSFTYIKLHYIICIGNFQLSCTAATLNRENLNMDVLSLPGCMVRWFFLRLEYFNIKTIMNADFSTKIF